MAELTDKQTEYLEWRADTTRTGTKRDWAAAHDVNVKTLRTWEKTEWFQNGLEEELRSMALGQDSMLEVAVALQKAAAGGDQQATRQYIALMERVNPTRQAPREARAVELLTDAELDAAWADARAL